jgi:uncharacterized membrane protein
MSGRFHFGEGEVRKSLKVFGWSMGAAFVALAISLTGALELPGEYAFIVPIVNTILYTLKEWVADNQHG